MADGNNIFNNVYAVTKTGNTYTVGTFSAGNASVSDTGTRAGDNYATLGDINNDGFTYNAARYTYVGKTGDGAFVAQDASDNYFLFSDTAATQGTSLTVDTKATTAICFLAGTMITTPDGEVSVETLRAGDLVTTLEGHTVPVRWLGRQTISTRFADPLRVLPICIKAGALAENVPSKDLYVSPDHAILIDNILVHASALVNGTSIVRVPAPASTFTYYHVELADHSLLLADNVPAESFIDNVDRLAFDNWDEHDALGDEAAPLVEMDYPRAKSARQVPVAIRERLAARAQTLFGSLATQAA